MAKAILGRRLLEQMAEAGVISVDDYVTRVVIDAQPNQFLRIYVERVGDERLLNVATTLEGVEISSVEKEK